MKFYIFLFCFLLSVISVNAQEECDPGWIGNDCSIPIQQLPAGGAQVDASVGYRQWVFFWIMNPVEGSTLHFTITQTGEGTDIDEYLIHGTQIPTRFNYDYRDISIRNEVTLTVENALRGRWILGCYGYQEGEFELSFSLEAGCPNDCSGHGECRAGTCRCYDGHKGEDCSIVDITVAFGEQYTGSVQRGEWAFYRAIIQEGQPIPEELMIELHRTNEGDADLYVRQGGDYPSFFTAQWWNVNTDETLELTITELQYGQYVVGVYGYRDTEYELVLRVTAADDTLCDNYCSLRGQCSGGRCHCQEAFSGDGCELMSSDLREQVEVQGFVESSAWNFYTIRPALSENPLQLHLVQHDERIPEELNSDSLVSDCDLFVRADQRPSRFFFDYAEWSLASDFTLDIPEPDAAQVWHVGVFGWSTCAYTLSYGVSDQCECGPSEHGHCEDGSTVCVCDEGFAGLQCEDAIVSLENAVAITASPIEQHQWHYYQFEIEQSSYAAVAVHQLTGSKGLVWLLGSLTADYPDLETNDGIDENHESNYHFLAFPFASPASRVLTFAVYGSPYNEHDEEVTYSIEAWYSIF